MLPMKDISTSILMSDGLEMKTGVLSILQKKSKLLKSNDYELNPLYWRLVSYAGQVYLLGYSKHLPGSKATKKLLIRACPKDMKLPERVVVSSNDSFLCIQCGQKTIFLQADSRRQRNKWVEAICSALEGPIYQSSALSTTSSDSSDSFNVLGINRDPRSVHNTADTAARPGNDWRRTNTSPAGHFQALSSVMSSMKSSIPSSAESLAMRQQRKWERETARSTRGLHSQESEIRPLNSVDRPRSLSQLERDGIFSDGDQYNGFEYNAHADMSALSLYANSSASQPDLHAPSKPAPKRLYAQRPQKSHHRLSSPGLQRIQTDKDSQGNKEPKYDYPSDTDNQLDDPDADLYTVENFYMPLKDDDQSTISRVDNLGPVSKGNATFFINEEYDDTGPPELPLRDYQNHPSGESNMPLTQELPAKKKPSTKKSSLPAKKETPFEQMDSIEREKTVCLEAAGFQRENKLQPTGLEKPDNDHDSKKRLPRGTTRGTREPEVLHEYIQRFRREVFDVEGVVVEVPKADLSPEKLKLVCVADRICVAELPNPNLHHLLHIDDVIVRVNLQNLPSIEFCYELFRSTEKDQVQLLVKRVVHGTMCHVELATNGDIGSLGLEFGNQSQGIEVTSMKSDGLVAKSGSLRSQTHGITNGGLPVNWALVEVNQSPVSLDSSPTEVRFQLQRAGCEFALVFLPMDIVNKFKEKLCGDEHEQDDKC